LELEAEQANTRWLGMTVRLQQLQRNVERALREESIHHCLKYGHEASELLTELSDAAHWPEKLAAECTDALRLLQQEIDAGVDDWIPRQTARSVAQASDFRHRTETETRWLEGLGYRQRGKGVAEASGKRAAPIGRA
jgi:hypothetical protein